MTSGVPVAVEVLKGVAEFGNRIFITRSDYTLFLLAGQGANPAKITDGFGGWQTVTRPHKKPLTLYQGSNPWQMTVNLMFDGWMNDESQERNLRVLTQLALPPQDDRFPVPLLIYGPLPYPSMGLWIINNIEYGDNTIWNVIGGGGAPVRVRQDVTVTFMQYVRPDLAAFTKPGEGLAPKLPTMHTVKQSDTLRRLAQFYYGDITRSKDIAATNAMKNPETFPEGYVGKQIRIPK